MLPASVLPSETIDSIRKHSMEAERQGNLAPEQLELVYKQKWFHLFVPEEYGGLALSLPEAVRLEENIAYADGSVGWVVTLCAGAAMFIGYFDKALADEIFTDENVCLAGSGKANGTATRVGDRFEINGSWPYASGARHATHFTANCFINGGGKIQSFVFKKDEVTLHRNWKYLGLNATAGDSFSVNKLVIPANRTFIIDPRHAKLAHPVYRYPFLQLAISTIAANISGMCRYFFDLAEQLLANKQSSSQALQFIVSGLAEMDLLRKVFYFALDDSWFNHVTGAGITTLQLTAVSQASLQLAQQSRNLVNQLYPYCGLEAANTDTTINQVWRNINTASQHTLLVGSHA